MMMFLGGGGRGKECASVQITPEPDMHSHHPPTLKSPSLCSCHSLRRKIRSKGHGVVGVDRGCPLLKIRMSEMEAERRRGEPCCLSTSLLLPAEVASGGTVLAGIWGSTLHLCPLSLISHNAPGWASSECLNYPREWRLSYHLLP